MRIKVEIIKEFMKKYRIREYSLCQICNISRRSIKNVLNNNHNATLHALGAIAKFMDIDISELIEQ